MKTRTFVMAALAAGVALVLSAQVQGQVVFPKVIFATTGGTPAVNIIVGDASGTQGQTVPASVTVNVLVSGALASAIAVADTSIPLVSAAGFPIPQADKMGNIIPVTIQICAAAPCPNTTDEKITYTAISGNNLTGATRGADNTTAAAHASGALVVLGLGGTQNDITFNGGVGGVITIPEGKACSDTGAACTTAADCAVETPAQTCDPTGAPACTRNNAIKKEATTFGYQPPGCCSVGGCPGTCTGLRSLVFSMTTTGSQFIIPSGSVLYTCNVAIAEGAADGDYKLNNSNDVASDLGGAAIPAMDPGTDGTVHVGPVGATNTPTHSPTATSTPGVTPTGPTPTPKGTNTAGPSVTRTRTIRTPGGGRNNDDDSCSIVSPANGHAGWMLLLPAAALLWIRRRSR